MTFLLAASWQDLRNKSVSIWLYLGYGAAAGVMRLIGGGPVFTILSGTLVGVVLLAAGRLTSGAIGSGDGMFFIVSGLYLSLNENIRSAFKRNFVGRRILSVSVPVWKKTRKKYTQDGGAVLTVPDSRLDLDGDFMKRRLKGSYTVEAAFVMALVLWAVLFFLYRRPTGCGMRLWGPWHCMEPQSICAMGRRGQQKRLRIMQNVWQEDHFHGADINSE